MGIASLVLGIVGVCFSFIPVFNYLFAIPVIIGLVLGIVDLVRKSKIEGAKKGKSIAGVVLNIIAILIIIIWTFAAVLISVSVADSGIIQKSQSSSDSLRAAQEAEDAMLKELTEKYNSITSNYNYNYNYDYDFDF